MNNIIYFKERRLRGSEHKMADLKRKQMDEIEKIVSKLLENNDLSENPCVDIVSLVKKDQFEVYSAPMDIETTGCILVTNDKNNPTRLIKVNTNFKNPENETDVVFKKSRFITAHEYGHFILHRKDGQPMFAHRDTDHRTDLEELEADYFARSILMPLKTFKLFFELLNDMGNNDENFTFEMLSKIFGVTKNKVKKRGEDLSVLSN